MSDREKSNRPDPLPEPPELEDREPEPTDPESAHPLRECFAHYLTPEEAAELSTVARDRWHDRIFGDAPVPTPEGSTFTAERLKAAAIDLRRAADVLDAAGREHEEDPLDCRDELLSILARPRAVEARAVAERIEQCIRWSADPYPPGLAEPVISPSGEVMAPRPEPAAVVEVSAADPLPPVPRDGESEDVALRRTFAERLLPEDLKALETTTARMEDAAREAHGRTVDYFTAADAAAWDLLALAGYLDWLGGGRGDDVERSEVRLAAVLLDSVLPVERIGRQLREAVAAARKRAGEEGRKA